VDYR
jgi:hypothetical protein